MKAMESGHDICPTQISIPLNTCAGSQDSSARQKCTQTHTVTSELAPPTRLDSITLLVQSKSY